MKEIKLNMDEQKSKKSAQPKQQQKIYDEEVATVESVERIPEKIYEKMPGTTRLQKLTTVSFIVICALICVFAVKTLGYVRTMSELKIPENAEIAETEDSSTEDAEVEYITQVAYSPTEAANRVLAESNNGKDWIGALDCPYTWTFKSDYEYNAARIQCLWLCTHNETGELLAFRVADYNGGTDEFDDENVYVTMIGGQYFAVD